jgi:hypothetical protein
MAWEQRGNRTYYYRSRKIEGCVVKEYVGGGLAGMLAAREDEARRRRQYAARVALRSDRDTFNATAAAHDELSRAADALMTAALVAAGFHRHDRGQWRKRHGSKAEQ